MLRLTVPRLSGHSGQDTQTYKSAAAIAAERERDPWRRLRAQLVPGILTAASGMPRWQRSRAAVAEARARVERLQLRPTRRAWQRYVFTERERRRYDRDASARRVWAEGVSPPPARAAPSPQGPRINLVTAVRRTLEHELEVNPRVVVFGEDVGRKGGVHAATMGLQEKFGAARVFDTSLSEEGIIGRAVGMAAAGLMPVPEIQFRKYADPAAEQLNDCGTMRWRTANRFAAPMVVRIPGGFFKCGDPVAQPIERSAMGARPRLAGRHAVERAGCGGIAARGAARQ